MKKDIRILLVDDHQVVRDGLQHMLAQEEDMEVIGQSANGEEALAQAEMLSPNIVLMDIKMPGVNGIELTRQLRERQPSCNIIMLTLYDEYLAEALQAGAGGYLLKDIKRAELTEAIRQVHRGELVISENIPGTPRIEYNKVSGEMAEGLLPEHDESMLQEVQLIIPPPVDNARLMGFISRVEVMFESRILQMVGSWTGGTAITIPLPKPSLLADILNTLELMSEVEAAGEKPLSGKGNPSLVKKVINVPKRKPRPSKIIFVNLKNGET